MPPQIEVLVANVNARTDCVLPTIEISLRLTNRTSEQVLLAILQYEVYLAEQATQHGARPTITAQDRFLTSGIVAINNMSAGQTREVKIQIPLTIDLNNAIYEQLLALEKEDIVFKLRFYGTNIFRSGSSQPNVAPITFYGTGNQIVLEAGLSTERWRRMISTYYRNLTWIAISRETFLKLKKLLDEKGYVSYDEVIKELLSR